MRVKLDENLPASDILNRHGLDDLAGTITVFHQGRLRIRLP